MKLRANGPVTHDGKDYAEGDTVDVKDKAAAAALVASGAASDPSGKLGADDTQEA